MSATPTIPTLIAAIVADVKLGFNPSTPSNVTTVHSYRRHWRDMAKFNSLFLRSAPDLLPGKVNGAMVYRENTEEIEGPEWFRFYSIDTYAVHMIAGMQDSGGLTFVEFNNQVEAVRDKLRMDLAIFGNTEKTSPVIDCEGPRTNRLDFGDYTVWEAILRLKAERIETKFS